MKTQDVLKPILFSPTLISIYREIRRMIIVTMVFVGLKHYHFISSWYWALSPLWLTLLIDEARMIANRKIIYCLHFCFSFIFVFNTHEYAIKSKNY